MEKHGTNQYDGGIPNTVTLNITTKVLKQNKIKGK